jgi:acetylornithine/N-succinyldiaminopimelate aminotransferase
MSATGQEKIKVGFGPMLSTFEYVPYNDSEALANAVDDETAAIMLEIIQGEGGIHIVEPAFLDMITQQCEAHGALLIIDEIQTGIGRTGKPFAFQHFDIDPDIITVAKGLGNGLPIGAVIGKEALADVFGPGSHGTTFGGNPVCIAAAEVVVHEVFQSNFLQETTEKGNYLLQSLREKLQGIEEVVSVRGMGLMIGIELNHDAAGVLQKLQKEGLLVLTAGPNVLRLLPPLTVTKEELDLAIEKIHQQLS